MNILPLVFSFLLIFSCIALTFLKEAKSFSLIETTFHGYHRMQRVVDNAIVKKKYRKINAQKNKKKQVVSTKNSYYSRRCLFPPLENSKFNLSPLLQSDTDLKAHPLYEVFASLLRTLYQKNLFSKEKKGEDLEYRLIEGMLKRADQIEEVESLSELYPEDPFLAKVYYKMLKGTNQYSQSEGIFPLGNFLRLEKADKAISISFASPSLLEALFGRELCAQILAYERKKWEETHKEVLFSKEELQIELMKSPAKASLLTSIEPYLDYSKQFTPRSLIGGRDKATGIAIEKRLD